MSLSQSDRFGTSQKLDRLEPSNVDAGCMYVVSVRERRVLDVSGGRLDFSLRTGCDLRKNLNRDRV